MGAMVTVFDPRGNRGEIPQDSLAAFVKAGGIPAVTMKSPDGTDGFVPATRMHEALSAGAKLQPFEQQDVKHPGFWATLYDDVKGMAGGAASAVEAGIEGAKGNPLPSAALVAQTAQTVKENMQHRRDEGRSLAYRTVAPVGDVLGVNTRGMEDAADEGNAAGVLGHAAAVPAVMAATEGVAHGAPLLADAVKAARAQRLAGNLATALEKSPKDLVSDLDATADNVDYAGEKPPKPAPWNAHDATKEFPAFAGGMDEWSAKPSRPLSDLDPATVARKVAARKPAAAQPAPTPKPTPAPITPSGDPFLDRLRGIARNIEQRPVKTSAESAAEASVPGPEQDLTDILRESMTPENLKRFRARKAAATVQ